MASVLRGYSNGFARMVKRCKTECTMVAKRLGAPRTHNSGDNVGHAINDQYHCRSKAYQPTLMWNCPNLTVLL